MDSPQDKSQAVAFLPANATALVLGICGTVVGLIALLGNWLSHLGSGLIPVAIIGAVISLVGVVAAVGRGFRAIELPVIGLVLGLAAILVVLMHQHQAATTVGRTGAVQLADSAREQRQADEAMARGDQRAAWQVELTNLLATLPVDQAALKTAGINFSNIQSAYYSYQQQKTYLTNDVYRRIVAQISMWAYERNGYAQSVAVHEARELNREADSSANDPNATATDPNATTRAEFRAQMELNYEANLNTVSNLDLQIAAAQGQLQSIAAASDQWQSQRFNTALAELTEAQNKVSADQGRIYYLQGMLAQ